MKRSRPSTSVMRAHREADGKEVASITSREVSSIIGGSRMSGQPPQGTVLAAEALYNVHSGARPGEAMEEGDSGVKYLIGRSAGKSAVIAAFIATHVATMAGLWFGGVRLPQFNFNMLNGWLVLGLTADPVQTFIIGGIIHYTSGIIWGVVFALIVHPALGRFIKPLAALTPTNNYIKGVLWGLV